MKGCLSTTMGDDVQHGVHLVETVDRQIAQDIIADIAAASAVPSRAVSTAPAVQIPRRYITVGKNRSRGDTLLSLPNETHNFDSDTSQTQIESNNAILRTVVDKQEMGHHVRRQTDQMMMTSNLESVITVQTPGKGGEGGVHAKEDEDNACKYENNRKFGTPEASVLNCTHLQDTHTTHQFSPDGQEKGCCSIIEIGEASIDGIRNLDVSHVHPRENNEAKDQASAVCVDAVHKALTPPSCSLPDTLLGKPENATYEGEGEGARQKTMQSVATEYIDGVAVRKPSVHTGMPYRTPVSPIHISPEIPGCALETPVCALVAVPNPSGYTVLPCEKSVCTMRASPIGLSSPSFAAQHTKHDDLSIHSHTTSTAATAEHTDHGAPAYHPNSLVAAENPHTRPGSIFTLVNTPPVAELGVRRPQQQSDQQQQQPMKHALHQHSLQHPLAQEQSNHQQQQSTQTQLQQQSLQHPLQHPLQQHSLQHPPMQQQTGHQQQHPCSLLPPPVAHDAGGTDAQQQALQQGVYAAGRQSDTHNGGTQYESEGKGSSSRDSLLECATRTSEEEHLELTPQHLQRTQPQPMQRTLQHHPLQEHPPQQHLLQQHPLQHNSQHHSLTQPPPLQQQHHQRTQNFETAVQQRSQNLAHTSESHKQKSLFTSFLNGESAPEYQCVWCVSV